MNDFDEAAKRVAQRYSDDPVERAAAAARDRRDDSLQSSLYVALRGDVETAAKAQKLGKKTGLPTDLVERNLKEVQLKAAMADFDDSLQKSPKLANWLAEQQNAKVAIDNVANMAKVERTLLGTLGDVVVTGLKGAVAVPEFATGLANFVTGGYAGLGAEKVGIRFKDAQAALDSLYSTPQQLASKKVRSADGFIGTVAAAIENPSVVPKAIGESLPMVFGGGLLARGALGLGAKVLPAGTVGPTAPGALARVLGPTAAPMVAAGFGEGAVVAGSMAEQLRKPGEAMGLKAGIAALGAGAGAGAIGALGAKIAQRMGVVDLDAALASGAVTVQSIERGFLSSVARAGLGESIEELTQSAQEQMWQNWAEDKPLMEGVGAAAAMGLLTGGPMGAGFQAIRYRAEREAASAEKAPAVAEGLAELHKLAAADKVLQRSPESFAQFIDQAAEGAPVQHVFMSADALMQSGLAAQVAAVSMSVASQLADASASGGTIAVPIAEYASTIANQPFADQLLDHLKIDSNGFSKAEAEQFVKALPEQTAAEIERVAMQASADASFQDSANVVRDTIMADMEAAGRFPDDTNKAYVGLVTRYYATQAANQSTTPEELYKRYPLRVVAEQVFGGQTLNQFAGPRARGADVMALSLAKQGLEAGQDAEAVRKATGWFKGVDGRWRFEISDKDADLRIDVDLSDAREPIGRLIGPGMDTLGDLLWHPALFAAYPDLASLPVRKASSLQRPGTAGSLSKDGITINSDLSAKDALSTLLHEVQHWIQKREGFARGSSPAIEKRDQLSPELQSMTAKFLQIDELAKENGVSPYEFARLADYSESVVAATKRLVESGRWEENIAAWQKDALPPQEKYMRSAGEVEARNTQARAGMDDAARRDTPPSKTADRKDSEVIVNWNGVDMDSMPMPVNASPKREKLLFQGNTADLVAQHNLTAANLLHAVKMGGIPVPSLAVTQKDKPLTNFGEITLLAPSAMVDPKGYASAKVFGADIYSPRYPEVQLQFTPAMRKQGELLLKAGMEATGTKYFNWNEVEREGVRELERTSAVLWQFLTESGIELPLVQEGDGYAAQRAMAELVRTSDLQSDLQGYVGDLLKQIEPNERIYHGFTNSGNRKYTPHTLENVVKILKKELRGGESFNYGVGSLRAKLTPQFKSLDQIRKAKGRLMDKASFEAVKNEVDTELVQIAEELDLSLEQTLDALEDAAKLGVARSLEVAMRKYNGGDMSRVDDAMKLRVAEYLTRLRDLPTEYFEAKILRDVSLSEFNGAVVPDGVDPKVLEALRERGVTDIRTYKKGDEADRAAKIGEFGDLFFQQSRGSFSPSTNTISLLKGADRSTFLHELGHFFLEMQLDMAQQAADASVKFGDATASPGEAQLMRDSRILLNWFGVESFEDWYALDFEARRDHHEKFARGFEAYLFEGKAPSIEVRGLFQRFRAWLVHVYKDLKALNVELTDEVRAVMDRMIATDAEIALAEQGRGMTALFESAEKAGMTTVEFAAYQALGAQPTMDAAEQLQAKSMRDAAWMRRAHGREVRKLTQEAAEVRREVRIEARAEVLQQPIYQAWQFLTARLGPDDKITAPKERKPQRGGVDVRVDSLLVAIAKIGGLNRQEVTAMWGLDPKERVSVPLFGVPAMRRTGGASIDGMATRLAEYGYLRLDENGKHDLHEFEERFFEELRGNPQYAVGFEYENPAIEQAGQQIANPDALTAARLDSTSLSMMQLPEAVTLALNNHGMVAKNGISADMVAERFDIGSGDELVRTLADLTPLNEMVETLTDLMMMEKHGELATPEAIAESADQAIHNKARTKFAAAEANALAKATGKPKVLQAAAEEYAAQVVARLRVRDLVPGQYARQAAKSGNLASKAFNQGDLEQAAAQKRNQVIQLALAQAAHEAKAEIEKARREWSTLARKPNDKLAKRFDMDVFNAVRAVLGNYGIAPATGRKASEYLEIVKKQDPETYDVLLPAVQDAEANGKPLAELTAEQARGVFDDAAAMTHLARRTRVTEVDGDLLDADEAAGALLQRLVDIGIPERTPGQGSAVTEGEERIQQFKTALAWLTRMESWTGKMDGDKPMESQIGPFRRLLYMGIRIGTDAYVAEKGQYLSAYRELVKGIGDSLGPLKVHAPEISYTFGDQRGGGAVNEIAHAILHTGNESNKRKLLLGRGWATEREDGTLDTTAWDAFLKRMIDEKIITRAHFDFAQGVWDLMEQMKPKAQQAHRDRFGYYFDEITAAPLATPFGTYRGGYIPAKVDPRTDVDAKVRELEAAQSDAAAFSFPATRRGFSKSRVEYNRPLMLDLRTLSQHIDEVLLFSNLENPVRDVNRLLMKIAGPLHKVEPGALGGLLKPWLKRAATQQVQAPVVDDAGGAVLMNKLRNRAGMAAMFANLANAAQQVTGFAMAAIKVRPSLLMAATAQYVKNPRKMARAVSEASPYIRERLDSEVAAMTGQLNEILLNPTLMENGQAWTMKHAYFLQSAVDSVLIPSIWTAAYNQAIEAKFDHVDAVLLADSTVRETQGSNQAIDISRIEAGSAYLRFFTQFTGYFNMQANLMGNKFVPMVRELGFKKAAGPGFYVFLMGFMIPATVGEMIMQAFRGGPDDEDKDGAYIDDWLASVLVTAPMRNATAMVPVLGGAVNAAVNMWNDRPYDDRMASSPVFSMLEATARAPVSLYKAVAEGASGQKAVRDVATLIAMVFGLPAPALARPIGYAVGVEEGRIRPIDELDAMRGAVTGVASPESKRK